MDVANKASLSDDEEDLDMLRLAALQTLKKNAPPSQALSNTQKWPRNDSELPYRSGNRSHGQFPNKRGRFYGGRGSKNGQFHNSNHRPVSSNLISLTPSVPREDLKPSHLKQDGISDSTLLLPQDKYSKKSTQVTEIHSRKSDETSSKFDRYKDSDKSEEEDSEDEILKSESDDDSLLKRSDSLEALMQELDDEIQGKPKAKDKEEKPAKGKIKTKRKKDASKTETEEEEEENKLKSETVAVSEKKSKEPEPELVKKDSEVSKSPKKVDDGPDKPLVSKDAIKNRERSPEQEPQPKKRRHSPSQRGFRGTYRGKHRDFGRSHLMHNSQFLPGNGPLPFHPNNPPPMFNKPPFGPPNLMMNPPPMFENALSPLLINTESLQTQTMAPLSPRSAAFVLQNRAIVEKRKRSPRRSYSRSPSPRRRSLSPRRSLTPPGRRSQSPRKRSLSPRKRSLSPPPLRKRSRSPPKRRSMSPKRRSPSPKRRNFSPKQRPLSPKLRPFSPKRRSVSPKRRPLSPKQRPLSPKMRPFSPKRRSLSPRRRPPLSPKQRPLSPKQRPLSPKQRPLSPKSRPFSPKRRSLSPKRRSPSPRRRERKDASENLLKNKPSVRDRLGLKSSSKPEEKDTKEKEKPSADVSPRKDSDNKPLDPILEARKKKFETREINVREGMIRLKPKVDPKTKTDKTELKSSEVVVESSKAHENAARLTNENVVDDESKATNTEGNDIDEEGLLEDDELDLEAQLDLFSDEESGSENEGRFKAKEEAAAKPAVLPFTKLVNGATLEIKRGLGNESRVKKRVETQSRSPRREKTKELIGEVGKTTSETSSRSDSSRRRSKTTRLPKTTDKEKSSSSTRKKLGVKSERHPKRFERKIEIKIKNPAKYERIDKADAAVKDINIVKGEKERVAASRRVELGTVTAAAAAPRLGGDEDDDDDETEIVVENDEDENSVGNEGDLRAQLSKKRAEKKLQKSSSSRAGVSSRLLQNALENALPIKKSKKSKSSKELSNSELATIKSLFTADFIASRLQLTVTSKRHVTVYRNKRFKLSFTSTTDGKLPIHRRLGLACSSDVFTKLKKKSKKRKNIDSEDQV